MVEKKSISITINSNYAKLYNSRVAKRIMTNYKLHTHTLLRNVNAAPSLANSRTANTATHKHTRAHTVTDCSCRCDYSARFARKPFKPYPRARMREKERGRNSRVWQKRASEQALAKAGKHTREPTQRGNPHHIDSASGILPTSRFILQPTTGDIPVHRCCVCVFFVLYRSPCLFIHRHSA